jgi:hypothetical protein
VAPRPGRLRRCAGKPRRKRRMRRRVLVALESRGFGQPT